MAEIRYHRVSSMKSRIESVLLFVPDVWSCVPTAGQWETIVHSYMQPSNEPVEADPEAKASQTTNSSHCFSFCFVVWFLISTSKLFYLFYFDRAALRRLTSSRLMLFFRLCLYERFRDLHPFPFVLFSFCSDGRRRAKRGRG